MLNKELLSATSGERPPAEGFEKYRMTIGFNGLIQYGFSNDIEEPFGNIEPKLKNNPITVSYINSLGNAYAENCDFYYKGRYHGYGFSDPFEVSEWENMVGQVVEVLIKPRI